MSAELFTIIRHTCDKYWVTPCCNHKTDYWVKYCPKCKKEFSLSYICPNIQKDFGKQVENWDAEDLQFFFLEQLTYKSKKNKNVRAYSPELKQELFQSFFCAFLNLYRSKNFVTVKELRNKFNGVYQNHQNSLRQSRESNNHEPSLFDKHAISHPHMTTAHLYIANQVVDNELGFWESFGKNLWRRLKTLDHLREICVMAFPRMSFSEIVEPYKQIEFTKRRFFRVWSNCPICNESACFGIVEHHKHGSQPIIYGNCCNPNFSEKNNSTPKRGAHSILTRLFQCEPHETKRLLILSLQNYFEEVA